MRSRPTTKPQFDELISNYELDKGEQIGDFEDERFRYMKHIMVDGQLFAKLDREVIYQIDDIIPRFSDLYSTGIMPEYRNQENIEAMIDMCKDDMEKDISSLFKYYPQLLEVGTEHDYFNYLKTIFPESVIRSIFYHGTKSNETFDEFDLTHGDGGAQRLGKGVYVTGDLFYLQRENFLESLGHPMFVVINSINPYFTKGIHSNMQKNHKDSDVFLGSNDRSGILGYEYSTLLEQKKGINERVNIIDGWSKNMVNDREYNGFVNSKIDFRCFFPQENPYYALAHSKEKFEYVCVPDPSNVHVLGSQKDQRGFRKYMNLKTN